MAIMSLQFLILAQFCYNGIKDYVKRKQIIQLMVDLYIIDYPLTLGPILFNSAVSFSINMVRSDRAGSDMFINYKLGNKKAYIHIHKKRRSFVRFGIDNTLVH